jgi:cytochrome c2
MKTTFVGTALVVVALLTGIPGSRAAAADSETGRAVFVVKRCTRCHALRGERASGPPLEDLRRPQGEMELAGRLWNHVPVMFTRLAGEGVEWPHISVTEMTDLMAYLGAEPARDPAPDLYKGQTLVLRKGCLKCHSLRREGGRVEPDLAERRADYASAAAWASAMWTHTPRMAAMAGRLGLPYPRFSGDEMGNLLAFLRTAADPPLPPPGAVVPARRPATEGGGR